MMLWGKEGEEGEEREREREIERASERTVCEQFLRVSKPLK